jgi:putative Holliday junction resolvase
MRALGIDPGDRRIGVALSDPTGALASPLKVLAHISRKIDAASIAEIAREEGVGLIVVGQATDTDGKPTVQGRKAARLAAAIREQTNTPVELWDESYSTKEAQTARRIAEAPRKKRSGHLDDLAAAVILQSYLDAQKDTEDLS